MSERTCGNCRWWDARTKTIGVCRRNPPPANGDALWPEITAKGFCGEWADGSITPEQEERRELVRRFAVAIVSAGVGQKFANEDVWYMAEQLADAEPGNSGREI